MKSETYSNELDGCEKMATDKEFRKPKSDGFALRASLLVLFIFACYGVFLFFDPRYDIRGRFHNFVSKAQDNVGVLRQPAVLEFDTVVIETVQRISKTEKPSVDIPQRRESQYVSASYFKQCKIVKDGEKFDCYPELGTTQSKCEARGCCYKKPASGSNSEGVPSCYYPLNYPGYVVSKKQKTSQGLDVILSRASKSYYGGDIMNLKMEVRIEKSTRLHIKIVDADKSRWEVPLKIPVSPTEDDKVGDDGFVVDVAGEGQPFNFSVKRSDGTTLLQTAGSFMYADQFLQLSYFLPSQYIYGLGEHRASFLHSTNWTRFAMWNHDRPPIEKCNLYGTHAFYLNMENDGRSHGVFLLNSNGMEVALQPAPAITWRMLGGVIDLYMFLGPSPSDVIRQYTEAIGRPMVPPYWGLGLHVCRWGSKTANATLQIVDNIRKYGIPHDTQWNDIDYMKGRLDYTVDYKGFGDLAGMVDTLHSRGMHYVMLIDVAMSSVQTPGTYEPADLGIEMDVFLKDFEGKLLEGNQLPGSVYFPDFTHPNASKYWTTIARNFYKNVSFDGVWLDMNELSNFVNGSLTGCPGTNLDNPPYVPIYIEGGNLVYRAVCPSSQQYLTSQYNIHNFYGFTETVAMHNTMAEIRGKRPFVIARSTFAGSGRYAGHWGGDNSATFYDMHRSIAEILSMNLFGIPFVGTDICGFNGNSYRELCQRWFELGAFYPFSRNQNPTYCPPQDPTSFGPEFAASNRKVYLTRYTLLPYLYTLLYKSNTLGHTVARPLFFEYPKDANTYSNDFQFLWGESLLISPVLVSGARSIEAYFPADIWYDYYTGEVISTEGGGKILDAPLDKINLHVRGGYILPCQDPALTTTISRKNKFGLLVALNSSSEAEGDLFWDDGDTIGTIEAKQFNTFHFTANKDGVKTYPVYIGYKEEPMLLGNVTVFGVREQPKDVLVNGESAAFSYNKLFQVLYVEKFSSSLLKAIELKWKF